jgi:hypothetical protein
MDGQAGIMGIPNLPRMQGTLWYLESSLQTRPDMQHPIHGTTEKTDHVKCMQAAVLNVDQHIFWPRGHRIIAMLHLISFYQLLLQTYNKGPAA